MQQYLVPLLLSVYADQSAVYTPTVCSQHEGARAIEQLLKSRSAFSVSEVIGKIQRLPGKEANYVTACLCAWAYESAFLQACRMGMPVTAILVAQETGDYEFGDHYYTYEWTPHELRKYALESKLRQANAAVNDLTLQLARLEETSESSPAAA